MSDCSEKRNPLVRNGTSQGQRALPKLSPTSVEIMDKSTEDWMVWGGKFSDYVHFTTLENVTAGTMKPFFTANVSAQLALVSSYTPTKLSQHIRELLLTIETGDDVTDLKEAFTELCDIVLSYFYIVDQLFLATRDDAEYNAILANHIRARLLPLETRTFAYYKAFLDDSVNSAIIGVSKKTDLDIFHEPILGHEAILKFGLTNLLERRYPTTIKFDTHYGNIAMDDSIFGALPAVDERIKYVSQHNFFTSILDGIAASITFITQLSQKYLSKYLTDWPDHEPNYALYLTWLQLLNASKAHLNELSGRHLDFYYKNVLLLRPLAQSADRAFLVLELNKVTDYYAVQNDTLFMGSKDDDGTIITYESIRETVLNKAKIKHLASLYYGDEADDIRPVINQGRLFAAPISNSADGLGAKLGEDVIAWHPFHIKNYVNGELAQITMPKAEVGFAIASHFLRLKEGLRKITLKLTLSKDIHLEKTDYKAYVTTEKGWLKLDTTATEDPSSDNSLFFTQFVLTVPADKDPVIAYNKEVHLGNLVATEPVLKIILEHKSDETFPYGQFSDTKVYSMTLSVDVGEFSDNYDDQGIKNLELHNDSSPLNPSKPFQPWGTEPRVGNSFIIGSDEIFYKKNAVLKLDFTWKDMPSEDDIDFDDYDGDGGGGTIPDVDFNPKDTVSGNGTPRVEIKELSGGQWKAIQNLEDKEIFRFNDTTTSVITSSKHITVNHLSDNTFLNSEEPWKPYSAAVNRGFIKVRLKNDFGHRAYYNALQNYFKLNVEQHIAPVYPYQPTLEAFSIRYRASCFLSMSTSLESYKNRPLTFFHLGPFGESEQHGTLLGPATLPKLVRRLVVGNVLPYKSQGSLLIGLENLQPGDTQSILFQVQEGSENPLLEKPDDHLKWHYLGDNNVWHSFNDDGVGDTTKGLIESGIISFIIPGHASLEHTALESNLIWIRCSVIEAPDAVCKIIGIFPNAIEVKRVIPEETEYETMLAPAGEIGKLLNPEAKIKKIDQPYASFNGKPKEGSEVFYLRASERLRHKDRAINIWDFERLVLQAFPEIYKCKCLNHTKIGGSLSEGNLVYNEVAPGHVSFITIPNLTNRNDIDPLRPYTKKSTLRNINEFLSERSSCQVTIHTAQPDFEEVKVSCTITLRSEFPDINYYKEVIRKDIVNFLSPWAFNSDTDLNFGGRVHQSVLIDFIEELPYVDFLTDFELIHITSAGLATTVDEAIASTGRSILVSVPHLLHELTVLLKEPSGT